MCQCRPCLSAFTVLLPAGNIFSLCNSISCLKFLNYLCPSKVGDYIPPTATTKLLELKFTGLGTFCKAALSGCLEKGADLKAKMAQYWYILGEGNRKGNPIFNVKMYCTANGLYKYRGEVRDDVEETVSKNPTSTRRWKRWISILRNINLNFTLACS